MVLILLSPVGDPRCCGGCVGKSTGPWAGCGGAPSGLRVLWDIRRAELASFQWLAFFHLCACLSFLGHPSCPSLWPPPCLTAPSSEPSHQLPALWPSLAGDPAPLCGGLRPPGQPAGTDGGTHRRGARTAPVQLFTLIKDPPISVISLKA